MRWIDTTNLKNWALTRDSQEILPLLIRRLIRATATNISHINFPAGDSVVYPGWDGILETTEETEYFPKGFSVWEIGTNQDVKGKAEEDYKKRTTDPLEVDPKETTFIFVTPRIWSDKDKWCREKKKEGVWNDVRVYDARALEEWIEQSPAVGAWLAKRLGIFPAGAIALEDFWIEWSTIPKPAFTTAVVIAGRDNQVEEVRKWLSSAPSSLAIQASTSNEALSFLAAVITTLPEDERKFYLSRAIVLEDTQSFKHITITGRKGLLLVARFSEIEGTPNATQKGHHVLIPLGLDNTVTSYKIELSRLGREAFIDALKKMGVSDTDAQKYSRETGRSLTVLRRRLTNIANQPDWAKSDSYRDIVPSLLAGRWTEDKEKDKEIISQLARNSYESFSELLSKWLHKPDSPILKIGRWWRLVSPMDAWFVLGQFITESDLQVFRTVALKVLGSINPALDLEPDKRWAASMYGKESPYSGTLREGIAQTLVLIAVFGDDIKISLSTTAQTYIDSIVKELLHNADWKLWYSLSDVIPLISEASPSIFLDEVEMSISKAEKPIMGMFSETDGPIAPSSAHPSLLWALEGLAWSPQLLGRVALILGKLSELDPGGKLCNRPINSLRDIFLLWLPHTFASLEQRLDVVDILIEREPEIGWDLLVSLMPHNHDSCSPTHKTRWRRFSEKTEIKVTFAEHLAGIKAITTRLLAHVGNDGHRCVKVLENFPSLPPDERCSIIERLLSSVGTISKGRLEMWNKLRYILSRHRSFSDADWALPERELKKLEKVFHLLEPKDVIDRFCWLFDKHWPDLPEGKKRGDHKEVESLIAEHRLDAVKTIKKEQGLEGLIKLAEKTINPILVGFTASESGLSIEEEQTMFSLLEGENDKKLKFIITYIFYQAHKNGLDWINILVEEARSQQWRSDKIINLFIALPQNRTVWDLIGTFDKSIQDAYWMKCTGRFFDLSAEENIYALKQLIQVKRYVTAIDSAALFDKELPPDLIIELLLKTATDTSLEDLQRLDVHDVEKLFEALDKSAEIKEHDVARLEWMYLSFLARVGSGRQPKMLHKELSNSPEFFAEVIQYIYKPKDKNIKDEENVPKELVEQRASLGWKLLHSWDLIPGTDSNGKINYETLRAWVIKARELCAKSDRKEVGDIQIGHVLAHSITENKNIWPQEPVCKIIDETQSEDLDSGFSTGIYNKRGVITRNPFEGGQQERALSAQFRTYSDNWTIRYPRTAAILSKIAESYENEARHIDKDAERRDLEY
ncbi:hypothetical protein C4544_03325 [candidate division WS5 bacterium]|uniref:Uncharacterized protein n=1 Tax=candidate division WS5 bacterium TaxID=2093353 RepID=A0A419DDQ1_9BACT|nr:MAG: hypothetical protein C4544_03325 [candidate division WS5 bacterium]